MNDGVDNDRKVNLRFKKKINTQGCYEIKLKSIEQSFETNHFN